MRQDDEQGTTLPVAAQERHNRERVAQWRARQRLVGSYVLGAVATWKILTVDGEPYLWVGLAALAFGLANIDQVLKALGRK
jgi:hypothetical protein